MVVGRTRIARQRESGRKKEAPCAAQAGNNGGRVSAAHQDGVPKGGRTTARISYLEETFAVQQDFVFAQQPFFFAEQQPVRKVKATDAPSTRVRMFFIRRNIYLIPCGFASRKSGNSYCDSARKTPVLDARNFDGTW